MRKVCKKCKIFVKGSECPICKSKELTTSWKGIAIILSPEDSEIAKKINAKVEGKYTLKA